MKFLRIGYCGEGHPSQFGINVAEVTISSTQNRTQNERERLSLRFIQTPGFLWHCLKMSNSVISRPFALVQRCSHLLLLRMWPRLHVKKTEHKPFIQL